MGSCCCNNVRVSDVPQQATAKTNDLDEHREKPVSCTSPPVAAGSDAEKGAFPSTTQFPSLPNRMDPNKGNKTSTRFHLQRLSKGFDLVNEIKPGISSEVPLLQHKVPSESEPLSNGFDRKNEEDGYPHVNLVQSLSDENDSDIDPQPDPTFRFLTIPERIDFDKDERFFTSTPIQSNADSDEQFNVDSSPPVVNHEDDSSPLTLLQMQRLQERIELNKYSTFFPFDHSKPLPEHLNVPVLKSTLAQTKEDTDSFEEGTIHLSDTSITDKGNVTAQIDIVRPLAFDESFTLKRQRVIDNHQYRINIESCRPNSIEQLVEQIKALTRNKPTIDRLWIVFYWVASNLEYDTATKHGDTSPSTVFRTKTTVSDGYANLFKRLCDDLHLPCEKVIGHSKSFVFDSSNETPELIDHTWNAVELNQNWYLVDSTWAAGYLIENRTFKRELNPYYFLPRSNEMIYHHFPIEERWQLLLQPIQINQYLDLPKLWPNFFQFDLKLLSPHNTVHVTLPPEKPFGMVMIQAPLGVTLMASLTLKDNEVDGGYQIVFYARQRLYCCSFAPAQVGNHKIRIYANRGSADAGFYSEIAEFMLNVNKMPLKTISFPQTWKTFFDFNLEIVSPCNTHRIKMDHGDTHAQILIRAPEQVELLGRLTFHQSVEIIGGDRVFLDRRKGLWQCLFAPHRDGLFEAYIMAKTRSDPGSYSLALRFKIEARRVPLPPLSYPRTWQLFYDLDLKVDLPKDRAVVAWPDYASYATVCIRTPDDVRLTCFIQYNGVRVDNGSLTQFNTDKQHCQLLFAPERKGLHKLIVCAHRDTNAGFLSGRVLEFHLNVTQLRHPIKFPLTSVKFLIKRCRIIEPLHKVLKKGIVTSICCEIPDAKQVNITVDSKWLTAEGYQRPLLKRQITVGSKEVAIFARFDDNTDFYELVKYSVQ